MRLTAYLKSVKLLILILFPFVLSNCAKSENSSKDIVAYVNKEPVYANELKREIALEAKINPAFKVTPEAEAERLDSIIDRKLIVQAAMKKGLSSEERFINTIKSFWEQTLIRDFIDYKNKQAQEYVYVSEEDINRYYDNLSCKVTFKIFRTKDKKTFNKVHEKYLKNKDTQSWQQIGPLAYEDINISALLDAFELPKGEAKEFYDGYNYYLIEVLEKEKMEIEPIGSLKPAITKRVAELKEQRLFENWLKAEREKAKIEINK